MVRFFRFLFLYIIFSFFAQEVVILFPFTVPGRYFILLQGLVAQKLENEFFLAWGNPPRPVGGVPVDISANRDEFIQNTIIYSICVCVMLPVMAKLTTMFVMQNQQRG